MGALLELIPPLLDGLWVTVEITVLAALLGVLAALLAGLGRQSSWRPVCALTRVYIEVFRGTSALVQLFWFYFALPFLGVDLTAMTASVLVLGLNTGAYGAEVVRGALSAVPPGQYQAGRALGMSEWQILRFIVLPQALVIALPPSGNLLIELLKNTALVSMVTLADLTFMAQIVRADTLRTTEIFLLVLLMYFALASLITAGVRALERKLAHPYGSHGRSGV